MTEIIAIDGTAGAGKSTIGKLLADHLNYLFVDTGVMYRAVTLIALEKGVDISSEHQVTRLADGLEISISIPSVDDGRDCDVLIGDRDVTWDIRSAAVDNHVSIVAAYPGVRKILSKKQREIGLQGDVVMMGRDIGTVILPEADLKLFLVASLEERANRRYRERIARGEQVDYESILAVMRERDQIDSNRDVAPLVAAADAIVIDTDGLSIDDVFNKILALRKNLRGQ